MKLLPVLLLACGAIVLTGCAGTETDFECNASTSDSCMTMDQANKKARSVTNSSTGKQAATVLPALVNPPQRIAVPAATPATTTTRVATPAAPVKPYAPVKPFAPRPVSTQPVGTTRVIPAAPYTNAPLITTSVTRCVSRACDDAGQVRAIRSSESTANVWIAPWVDTGDVLHQPGRVSFVVKDSQWQLPAVIE
ncbi:type IV conjugative transfer system lipoprotein TraV [Erwinia billingiae]|uniref:type IV conjugative transfer system lipoprotein TraV n=1 Tax=Erwinia billingiae TaxID=182337 RepID=UPI003207C2A0